MNQKYIQHSGKGKPDLAEYIKISLFQLALIVFCYF